MSTGKLVALIIIGIFIAFIIIYIVILYRNGELQKEHIYTAIKDVVTMVSPVLISL